MNVVSLKEINRLAVPAILAGIAEPLISLADTAIIGQLEDQATASQMAVGLASRIFLLIIWGLSQTRSGVSALVSKYYGKYQINRIKSLVSQALWLNIALGVFFLLLAYVFLDRIFLLYKPEGQTVDFEQVKGLAEDYFSVRCFGFPLSLATLAMFGAFRGLQNTLWAMIISLVGGGLNLILDFLLVFGIEGIIPGLGVVGAAYATLIAQVVMFLMAAYMLVKHTPFDFKIYKKVSFEMRNFIVMCFNLILRTIALNIAVYFSDVFAASYGVKYSTAHSILVNIWLFTSFFLDGYSNAGNAISGKLLGQKNYLGLWKLTWDVSKIGLKVSAILVIILLIFYPIIGSLFSNDIEVVNIFESIFWLLIISLPINSVAYVLDGVFKGMGEATLLRNALIIATFVGFLPVVYFCDYFGLSIFSVWIAFIVWMVFRASTLAIIFIKKYGALRIK